MLTMTGGMKGMRGLPVLPTLVVVVTIIILSCACQASSASPQVGSPCDSDSDCKSGTTFLKCTRRACRCDQVSHFDSAQGICLVHTGGSCDVSAAGRVGSKKCVPNAVCRAKSRGATIGSCECTDGYDETTHGTCESASSYTSGGHSPVSIGTAIMLTTLVVTTVLS